MYFLFPIGTFSGVNFKHCAEISLRLCSRVLAPLYPAPAETGEGLWYDPEPTCWGGSACFFACISKCSGARVFAVHLFA